MPQLSTALTQAFGDRAAGAARRRDRRRHRPPTRRRSARPRARRPERLHPRPARRQSGTARRRPPGSTTRPAWRRPAPRRSRPPSQTRSAGSSSAPALATPAVATTLTYPDAAREQHRDADLQLGCALDCLYLVTLNNGAGRPVVAARGALAGGAARRPSTLPKAKLAAGSYRVDVRLVNQVNPAPVVRAAERAARRPVGSARCGRAAQSRSSAATRAARSATSIVGGVLPPAGATVFEQMQTLRADDSLRKLLLREPRGSVAVHANLIVPATQPGCDAGFIIMEPTEYPAMSGSNTICVATVLLETGHGRAARAGDDAAARSARRRGRGSRRLPRRPRRRASS